MSKQLWQLQAEGKEVAALATTDLIYILRDPQTGRFDRVITAINFLKGLGLSLDSLTDVVIDGPTLNQVLKYNGTMWINAESPGGALILDELLDVNAPAPVWKDLLRFDGTQWVNWPDYNYAQAGHAHFTTTDGDKGEISVTGGIWTIDNGVIVTAKIADNNVTNAKLADMVQNRIKGRVTASTGDPEDLTPANARTVLASDSGGGTTNFLRADATWAAPVIPDEIFVGPSDPGLTYELWYDSDEGGAVPVGIGLPPGGTVGQFLTKKSIADYDAEWQTYGQRCGVGLTRAAVQSIATSAFTTIVWDTEVYDTDGFWSSGPTITIPAGKGGIYTVSLTFISTGVPGHPAFIFSGAGTFWGPEFGATVANLSWSHTLLLAGGSTFTCQWFNTGATNNATAQLNLVRVAI